MPATATRRNPVALLGAWFLAVAGYVGGLTLLLGAAARWVGLGILRRARFGWAALAVQGVRLGVRSVGIVVLVQLFIGVILALQMAPPLKPYGQVDAGGQHHRRGRLPRCWGRSSRPSCSAASPGRPSRPSWAPWSSAEEIEALQAIALNPVRFLVVPRVLATVVMLVC